MIQHLRWRRRWCNYYGLRSHCGQPSFLDTRILRHGLCRRLAPGGAGEARADGFCLRLQFHCTRFLGTGALGQPQAPARCRRQICRNLSPITPHRSHASYANLAAQAGGPVAAGGDLRHHPGKTHGLCIPGQPEQTLEPG
jgi:hypothetical protein